MRYLPIIVILSIPFLWGCSVSNQQEESSSESFVTDSTTTNKNPLDSINQLILANPNMPDYYVERAKQKIDQRDFDGASSDLNRALALDSANSDTYVLLATINFRTKKFNRAGELLQKSLVINPNHVSSNLKMAEMFMVADNYTDAFKHVNNVLKEDVYNADAYFLKGMIFKLMGDTAKSVTSFQTCVEQNPDYYDAHIQLGLLYASVLDDLALAYYDNALDIRPKSLEALYNKALYQQTKERFEEADRLYNQILAVDSTYYIAYYNKAYLRLVYTTDYDSAIYLFSEAISFDEKYFEAFYNRGYAYELQGNNKEALKNYQQALAIKPDFTLAAKGVSRVK